MLHLRGRHHHDHRGPLWVDPSLLVALEEIFAVGGASLDLCKTEIKIVTIRYSTQRQKCLPALCFTFCSFLNEDAFMFSESLTEKYCISRLRITALNTHLFAQRSNRVVNATGKGYKVAQLAEYLVHLPDLLLVLQVDWSVEVRHFVFVCCTLAHNVILTRMHELSQRCKTKSEKKKRPIINSRRQREKQLGIGVAFLEAATTTVSA